MKTLLIFSCEHGGNQVPGEYTYLFDQGKADLTSHRGYDPGARQVYELLHEQLPSAGQLNEVSRLLVELNRSQGHPGLFSKYTKTLPPSTRKHLLQTYYYPYRQQLEKSIADAIRKSFRAIHISVHSFTPELNGDIRNAEIGLLYDPSRPGERRFCLDWQAALRKAVPEWRIRRNYPYLGKADGLTTSLRKKFPAEKYMGIELEINQALLTPVSKAPTVVRPLLISLQSILP